MNCVECTLAGCCSPSILDLTENVLWQVGVPISRTYTVHPGDRPAVLSVLSAPAWMTVTPTITNGTVTSVTLSGTRPLSAGQQVDVDLLLNSGCATQTYQQIIYGSCVSPDFV